MAKIGKEEGFSVILNGHVDVVPAGDRNQWVLTRFPERLRTNASWEEELLT